MRYLTAPRRAFNNASRNDERQISAIPAKCAFVPCQPAKNLHRQLNLNFKYLPLKSKSELQISTKQSKRNRHQIKSTVQVLRQKPVQSVSSRQ